MALTKLDPNIIGQDSTGAGKITSAGGSVSIDSSGNVRIANSSANSVTVAANGGASFAGTLTANSGVTFNDASIQTTAASGFGFKNRIINGAMSIFQRGVAANTDLYYSVDRWRLGKSNDAVESVTQSTDAPSGFAYSIRNTVGTADTSIGAGQYSNLKHAIEACNIADFCFGTANAKTVTLSFWVKSSVVGLYSGNICNYDESRICPYTYTINAANTWEYKTITLAGDTSGTWATAAGVGGLSLYFYMALGSNYYNGTPGTWGAPLNYGAGGSSHANVLATVGNIFAITGVQLEKGSTATAFDYRDHGNELRMCQRYCQMVPSQGMTGSYYSTTQAALFYFFPVTMRVAPVATFPASLSNAIDRTGAGYRTPGTIATYYSTVSSYSIIAGTLSSETTYNPCVWTGSPIQLSAEL